jgi:hypothetical protein
MLSSDNPSNSTFVATSSRQTVVVQPEQLQRPSNIILTPDGVTYPPGLRQDVVQLRFALGHELLPGSHRERKVGQPIPVKMPDLVSPYPKLDAVEPVWFGLYPRPARYLTLYRLRNARHVKSFSIKSLLPNLLSRLSKFYSWRA